MTDSAIQRLKTLHPIEAVIGQHVRLRRSGKYLVGHCPFHPDKTPSLAVNPKTGRWRCFGRCGTGWLDVIDFVGWQHYGAAWNARDPEMFKRVLKALRAGSPSPAHTPSPADRRLSSAVERRPLRPGSEQASAAAINVDARLLLNRVAGLYRARLWAIGVGPETPLAYLRSRGFTDATIREAQVGYCAGDQVLKYLRQTGVPLGLARGLYLIDAERGDREFMRGRIVIPDLDAAGDVLHLCGRKWDRRLSARAPKYLSQKGIDKPLYGWAKLDKAASAEPVFVSESLTDWLTLRQWRLDALAMLGTTLKEAHARLLAWLPRPIIYLPHNDGGAGLEAVARWRAVVGHGEIVALPAAIKDVAELLAAADGQETFFGLLP